MVHLRYGPNVPARIRLWPSSMRLSRDADRLVAASRLLRLLAGLQDGPRVHESAGIPAEQRGELFCMSPQ